MIDVTVDSIGIVLERTDARPLVRFTDGLVLEPSSAALPPSFDVGKLQLQRNPHHRTIVVIYSTIPLALFFIAIDDLCVQKA